MSSFLNGKNHVNVTVKKKKKRKHLEKKIKQRKRS